MQNVPFETVDLPPEVAIVEDPRGLLMRISSDMTAQNTERIRSAIAGTWARRGNPRRLALDLSAVDRIDSSGVGGLLDLARTAQNRSAAMVLCGLHASPLRLLQRTGLLALFRVAGSVDEAMATPLAA